MSKNRLGAVLALGALVLLAVGGGWAYNINRTRSRVDAARAQQLVAEARQMLATATSENLLPLAPEAFAAASGETDRAAGLLALDDVAAALPAAELGLEKMKAARADALGRTPVTRTATLKAWRNSVLYRPASAVDWTDVKDGMSLFDRDRLSTKQASTAVVRFAEGNEMRVEENSVMVVERYSQSRTDPTIAMTLSVPQGNVRSNVSRENGQDVRLEINLPKASVTIDTAKSSDGRSEVAAGVHGDASQRIAVYTGEAQVVSPSGEKLVLHQNEYATVSPDGKLSEVKALPSSAIILLPGRNAVVYTSQQRPEVTFKWSGTGTCAAYRLEVASDTEFLDKLVDEKVRRTLFTYGNLKPGNYFWRMSCLGADGAQGAYSEVSLFDVRVDNDAPKLAILAPEANAVLAAASIEARCRTEGSASVFINGEEAAGRDGEFSRLVSLSPGLNTLVFEAVDAAGNVIYNSRLVTRR